MSQAHIYYVSQIADDGQEVKLFFKFFYCQFIDTNLPAG